MTVSAPQLLQLARDTLDIEAAALQGLKARLDERFVRAVEMMLTVKGRVVVTGMGKSGHIGRKIAATLASTGTPAITLRVRLSFQESCRKKPVLA